jgi:3-methyladenine DNA glycosylase/8-oxoguanine DNA glycosylase
VFEVDGRLELTEARQWPSGALALRAPSDQGLERLRFSLAVDDDHSPFLDRFARDPLLARSVRRFAGLRPSRCGTVAQALLRALCGQLIAAHRARTDEWKVIDAVSPRVPGTRLYAPPTRERLAALGPAQLRALGLGTRRGSALVRLCRSLDLERLRSLPTDAVARRLERERGLGPWSVGLICLEGLGRYERGLVGDLGLIKLCSALRGRSVEAWETAELLEPYGQWAGLASVYLLAGFRQGLIPLPRRLAA